MNMLKFLIKRIGRFIHKKPNPIDQLKNNGAKVGNNVFIAGELFYNNFEAPLIEIGDWVTFATGVKLILHDSSLVDVLIDKPLKTKFGNIKISNNVYVGAYSTLMPGINIGAYSIVGAGSLVVKDIPHRTVWAGVPAKKLYDLDDFAAIWLEKDKENNGRFKHVSWDGLSLKDFCLKYGPRHSSKHSEAVFNIFNIAMRRNEK